ncbi:MAG: hypothetical protein HKN94_13210 [Acidimicrobiales bacterium]|nr:hypothetical protein [Acidimicrobiales bacterium]RZV41491.1 MAG: hypothetical protein EX269_16265 [Acidimicrobiales bacterium]
MKNALRLLLLVLMFSGCSGSDGTAQSKTEDGSEPSETAASADAVASTTTTIASHPPELEVPPSVRADVGSSWSDAVFTTDADGDAVRVTVGEMPLGFFPTTNARGLINGFEWRPPEPGRWSVEVVATDETGLRTSEQITLIGRNPRNVDLVLAVGDGVAAGEGLDRGDLLRRNDCGRAESESYPRLAFDALRATGALADEAEIVSVACNGMSASRLRTMLLKATNASGNELAEERTSLDWAVALNPTIVTITVGAADASIADPDEVIVDGTVDPAQLADRLQTFEDELDAFTEVLISHTDAHIALTSYANATADNPRGIDGCNNECFADAMELLHEQLHAAIRSVARRLPPARVSVVDFTGLLDGHRAGDPVGLDLLRAPAHCADDDEPDESWVSNFDCINPNERGHRALADVLTETLNGL